MGKSNTVTVTAEAAPGPKPVDLGYIPWIIGGIAAVAVIKVIADKRRKSSY